MKIKTENDLTCEECSIYDLKRRQGIIAQAGSGVDMLDIDAIENIRKEKLTKFNSFFP